MSYFITDDWSFYYHLRVSGLRCWRNFVKNSTDLTSDYHSVPFWSHFLSRNAFIYFLRCASCRLWRFISIWIVWIGALLGSSGPIQMKLSSWSWPRLSAANCYSYRMWSVCAEMRMKYTIFIVRNDTTYIYIQIFTSYLYGNTNELAYLTLTQQIKHIKTNG